jgi:hypothetical protein
VTAVDYGRRLVTLTGPRGNSVTLAVGPEVAKIDQLRAGDRVVYRETTIVTAFAGEVLPGDIKVGTLQCDLSPTIGLVVGSHQTLACRFQPDNGGPIERYAGSINRIGLDIGVTAGGRLAWAVYAPTTGLVPGGLAGTYVGASGDVTIGVGVGANLLVGGSGRTAALQPLSVEGQFGANLALGIANLSLWSAP